MKLITDIHPHYIKLDMNLVRDIDNDGIKYALIKTLYEFCLITDIKVIAEGIETENELNALIDIGINYGQGYLMQKPNKKLKVIDSRLVDHILLRNKKKSILYQSKPSTVYVGDISRSNDAVMSTCIGSNLLTIFNDNPSVFGMPVVDNNKLVGLIMRDKFFAKLGTQYGFALFVNRPISILMDKRPLSVDYAKHLNPLSGLPGNVIIEQKLRELVTSDFHIQSYI